MDKGIGFSRTITLDWLDVAASLCLEQIEPAEIRVRLVDAISENVKGEDAQRKTIDVIMAIWVKAEKQTPQLWRQALEIFPTLSSSQDRMWLHYGMTLICYPIFRSCTTVLGQIGRSKDTVTRKEIKERIAGEYGHLGSLDRSVERIIASLTNWGILEITDSIKHARIHYRSFGASVLELEVWQLACALHAHPSNGIPFDDLVRLPELFPFRFKMGIDSLQHDQRFEIYRQGGGYDLVKGLW